MPGSVTEINKTKSNFLIRTTFIFATGIIGCAKGLINNIKRIRNKFTIITQLPNTKDKNIIITER